MKNDFRFILVDDDPFALNVGEQVIRHYRKCAEIRKFNLAGDALKFVDIENRLTKDKERTVLLTDLHMPSSDGFELLDQIECRFNVIKDCLHIFVVSASACPSEIKRVLSYNCVIGYYLKPLSIEKMGQILQCVEYPL